MIALTLQQKLAALNANGVADSLMQMLRGIEKESLRVNQQGELAKTPHPQTLGNALTHPYITTDYSEALLELVTPAETGPDAPLQWLDRLHRFTHQQLAKQDELVWNNSMPCVLGDDNAIPVARYGDSNSGRMKYIYRLGLGHRYGRRMQTIAGIHYNVSFPQSFWRGYQQISGDTQPLTDFISEQYFGLLRNFQRFGWMLTYLFGATPAVCSSFLEGKPHPMLEDDHNTLKGSFATSLRMSDLGYQNDAQSSLQISLDDLESYVDTLTYAISTEEPAYQRVGLRDSNGRYKQLNSNILQIENEFYSAIRPKRITQPNERPTLALANRGVEYVEIRSMDIDPFEPTGISQDACRFLDLFATYCLLEPSPRLSYCDINAAKQSMRQMAYSGRRPGLLLWRCNESVTFSHWANELCDGLDQLAEVFDRVYGGDDYRRSMTHQRAKIKDPSLTPSAKVLNAVEQSGSFFAFAMAQAEANRRYFEAPPTAADAKLFSQLSAQSIAQAAALKQQDGKTFEQYLSEYFQGVPTGLM